MRVLIVGCGYTGGALAARLVAAGHDVFGARRRPRDLPAGVRPVAADVADPASLARLPEADAVVYAVSAGERSDAAYATAYVHGVEAVLERRARGDRPDGRLLFVSSTGVYAQDDGGWVDEDSPTRPSRFAGRRLLEGEALVRAQGGVVLRLAGIYGPGRTSLVERVRSGEARVAPGPPRYTNRIHRDDAAQALQVLLEAAAPPPVVIGVDSDPAPEREVLGWLAERLGVPPPREAPPAPGSRRAGSNKRCRNRRLLGCGVRLRYPSYREGYAAELEAPAPAGGTRLR